MAAFFDGGGGGGGAGRQAAAAAAEDAHRRAFRQQMRGEHRAGLGLRFCDDDKQRARRLSTEYHDVSAAWEAEAALFGPPSLVAAAMYASTTDNDAQTIENTLRNDRQFWSSTGSPSGDWDEALTYRLVGPACVVAFVQLAAYRAVYQAGYPVYPPVHLQVWAGPSPAQLHPASDVLEVQATDALQTFALHPHAPAARCLQLRLFGKLQEQQEDMRFYTAIRHVTALGRVLQPLQLLRLEPLLRSGAAAALGAGGRLPASCGDALAAMAGWGLGPAEAASGTLAGGRLLQAEQQQRQRDPDDAQGCGELVVRRQRPAAPPPPPRPSGAQPVAGRRDAHERQRQQEGQEGEQQQQQQQRQGPQRFWASLGSTLCNLQGAGRQAGGEAAAGGTVSDSIGGDGGAGGHAAPRPVQAADAANACTPRWLLPSAAAAGSHGDLGAQCAAWFAYEEEPGEEQQQQLLLRRRWGQGQGPEDSGEEVQQAARPEAWSQADNLRMAAVLWQALNRAEDLQEQEQVLAAWLGDDALPAGRRGVNENPRHALGRQQQQQQQPRTRAIRPPATLAPSAGRGVAGGGGHGAAAPTPLAPLGGGSCGSARAHLHASLVLPAPLLPWQPLAAAGSPVLPGPAVAREMEALQARAEHFAALEQARAGGQDAAAGAARAAALESQWGSYWAEELRGLAIRGADLFSCTAAVPGMQPSAATCAQCDDGCFFEEGVEQDLLLPRLLQQQVA